MNNVRYLLSLSWLLLLAPAIFASGGNVPGPNGQLLAPSAQVQPSMTERCYDIAWKDREPLERIAILASLFALGYVSYHNIEWFKNLCNKINDKRKAYFESLAKDGSHFATFAITAAVFGLCYVGLDRVKSALWPLPPSERPAHVVRPNCIYGPPPPFPGRFISPMAHGYDQYPVPQIAPSEPITA